MSKQNPNRIYPMLFFYKSPTQLLAVFDVVANYGLPSCISTTLRATYIPRQSSHFPSCWQLTLRLPYFVPNLVPSLALSWLLTPTGRSVPAFLAEQLVLLCLSVQLKPATGGGRTIGPYVMGSFSRWYVTPSHGLLASNLNPACMEAKTNFWLTRKAPALKNIL